MTEIWNGLLAGSLAEMQRAVEVSESAGYAGIVVGDSQALGLELWSVLGALSRTTDLDLGSAIAAPVIRHPSVTAASSATLQALTGGRFRLAVGRGDSALAFVGHAPIGTAWFRRFLVVLQSYLQGQDVSFATVAEFAPPGVRGIATVDAGRVPEFSTLRWLPTDLPKVPLEVAASGPRVLRAAAEVADGILLSIGSDPERLATAMEDARRARAEAGGDPSSLQFSALMYTVPHTDLATSEAVLAGHVAWTPRWMSASDPSLREVAAAYDMTVHHDAGADQPGGAALAGSARRYGVGGSPDECIEQLQALVDLGIDRLIIPAREREEDSEDQRTATRLLLREVLPNVRPSSSRSPRDVEVSNALPTADVAEER